MNSIVLPPEKMRFLTDLVAHLSWVPGMVAVVLGGSYARGVQHSASDLDVGLYYREGLPFDVDALTQTLARPGCTPEALQSAVGDMAALWMGVVELSDGAYRPQFRLV